MDIRGIGRNMNSGVHEYETFTKEKDNQQKTEYTKSDSGIKADKIKISSEAKQLNIIDFAVNKIKDNIQKDVPADKINKLKAQIKSGSYQVDVRAIADTILSGVSN